MNVISKKIFLCKVLDFFWWACIKEIYLVLINKTLNDFFFVRCNSEKWFLMQIESLQIQLCFYIFLYLLFDMLLTMSVKASYLTFSKVLEFGRNSINKSFPLESLRYIFHLSLAQLFLWNSQFLGPHIFVSL